MKYFLLMWLMMLVLSPLADAQERDSFFYMKDDGIFSEEEKDTEAEYIFNRCKNNAIKSIYYDCACVAGILRTKRDEPKLTPQNDIILGIYHDENTQCVNTVAIAGESFENCMDGSSLLRERDTPQQKEAYCTCVANKTATTFSRNPKLRTGFINNIKVEAMKSCHRQVPSGYSPTN